MRCDLKSEAAVRAQMKYYISMTHTDEDIGFLIDVVLIECIRWMMVPTTP